VLTNRDHLIKLPQLFHLNIPPELSEEIEKSPDRVMDIGIAWARKQTIELLDKGAPGVHFYVMANPTPTLRVINDLRVRK
jgi:methylenetetrahydrofolate reductase (NADPH)